MNSAHLSHACGSDCGHNIPLFFAHWTFLEETGDVYSLQRAQRDAKDGAWAEARRRDTVIWRAEGGGQHSAISSQLLTVNGWGKISKINNISKYFLKGVGGQLSAVSDRRAECRHRGWTVVLIGAGGQQQTECPRCGRRFGRQDACVTRRQAGTPAPHHLAARHGLRTYLLVNDRESLQAYGQAERVGLHKAVEP